LALVVAFSDFVDFVDFAIDFAGCFEYYFLN
jgi:hypothetical protein